MILPLRVFGRPSAKRIRRGAANLPILGDVVISACFISTAGGVARFRVTKTTSAWPFQIVGAPDGRSFCHALV